MAIDDLLSSMPMMTTQRIVRHVVTRLGRDAFVFNGDTRVHSRRSAAAMLVKPASVVHRHGDVLPSGTSRAGLAFLTKASKGIKGVLTIETLLEAAPILDWSLVEHPVATRLTGEQFWEKVGGLDLRSYEVVEYSGELWFKTRERAQDALDGIRRNPDVSQISGEPMAPEPGHLYVDGLRGPSLASRASGAGHQWTLALRKAWIGEPGWTLTTSGRAQLDFALIRRSKSKVELPSARIWTFLYKAGLQQAASQALSSVGQETIDRTLRPSAVRDLENTGTCPCCFRNIKLRGGRIVDHGWQEASTSTWRAGGRQRGAYGMAWHTGACFGSGYPPFELSRSGTEAYAESLVRRAEQRPPPKAEEIAAIEGALVDLRRAIASWKPKPLPG